MWTQRLLVHESVASQFREAFVAAVQIQILKESDMESMMIETTSADEALIAGAVEQGAHLEHGTAETVSNIPTRILPTVVSGVDKTMQMY
jgi:acyl-CoA reductase-like NAD-dependent aldehyde dehydrogenase